MGTGQPCDFNNMTPETQSSAYYDPTTGVWLSQTLRNPGQAVNNLAAGYWIFWGCIVPLSIFIGVIRKYVLGG